MTSRSQISPHALGGSFGEGVGLSRATKVSMGKRRAGAWPTRRYHEEGDVLAIESSARRPFRSENPGRRAVASRSIVVGSGPAHGFSVAASARCRNLHSACTDLSRLPYPLVLNQSTPASACSERATPNQVQFWP